MPPKKPKTYFAARVKLPKHVKDALTAEKKAKAMAGRAATYARDRAEMERTVAIAKQTAKDAARGMQAVAGTAATAAGAAARKVKQGALRGLDATRSAIEKGEEAIGAARETYERVKPELRLRYANARLVLARYKRDAARVLYGTPGRPAVPRSRLLPFLGNIEEAVPPVEGLVPKAYRFMRRGRDIAERGAERVGDVVRQNREVMQRFFAERRMLAEHARLTRERNLDALIRTTNMAAPVPLPGPPIVLPQPIIAPLPAAAGALAPAAPLAAPAAPLAAAAPAHLEAMDNAQLLAHVQALQQQLQNPHLGPAGAWGQ